jgi:hypothetical protein
MKWYSSVLALSFLLGCLFFGVQPLVDAGYFYPHPMDPYIIFNSPQNNSYCNGYIGLDISVGTFTWGQAPGESYEVT